MSRQYEIRAYKHKDHYVLSGNTFIVRDTLKLHKGWPEKIGEKWIWHVSKKAAKAVHAIFQIVIRVSSHCHEPEEKWIVPEGDAMVGKVLPAGCSMCDSITGSCRATVLEVIGEAPWRLDS